MSSPANVASEKQEPQDREGQIATLGKLIKGVDIAMLTTEMPNGQLRSRPMSTQNEDFDGTLWFLTDKTTPKIGEIEGHAQVNVSYANPSSSTYARSPAAPLSSRIAKKSSSSGARPTRSGSRTVPTIPILS